MNCFTCLDCKKIIWIRHLKLEEGKPEDVTCDNCGVEWKVTNTNHALSCDRAHPEPRPPAIKTKSRIPLDYVIVKGAGQTSFGPGIDPWETATYDIALEKAGIQNYNVVKYTSVIPPESNQITMKEAKERNLFHHGMVLESIMAQVNGTKGQHICAGVGTIQVYESIDAPTGGTQKGKHIGGFAAEYEGYASPTRAKELLNEALKGIVHRRYRLSDVWVGEQTYTIQDLVVDEDYGCVLVALGFLTFEHPLEGSSVVTVVDGLPGGKTLDQLYEEAEKDPSFGKVQVRPGRVLFDSDKEPSPFRLEILKEKPSDEDLKQMEGLYRYNDTTPVRFERVFELYLEPMDYIAVYGKEYFRHNPVVRGCLLQLLEDDVLLIIKSKGLLTKKTSE